MKLSTTALSTVAFRSSTFRSRSGRSRLCGGEILGLTAQGSIALVPESGQSSSLRAETKASLGTSTRPIAFIFFLPFFCCSRSLRFRVMSPP